MAFGDTLRKVRKSKKLTIVELAEKAGVDKTYLSVLENKKRKNPSMKIFVKICDALNITVESFLKSMNEDEKVIMEFEKTFGENELFKTVKLEVKKELLKTLAK